MENSLRAQEMGRLALDISEQIRKEMKETLGNKPSDAMELLEVVAASVVFGLVPPVHYKKVTDQFLEGMRKRLDIMQKTMRKPEGLIQ